METLAEDYWHGFSRYVTTDVMGVANNLLVMANSSIGNSPSVSEITASEPLRKVSKQFYGQTASAWVTELQGRLAKGEALDENIILFPA